MLVLKMVAYLKSVNGGQTWENKTNGLEVPGLE